MRHPDPREIEGDPVLEILLALAFAGGVTIVAGVLWAIVTILRCVSGAV